MRTSFPSKDSNPHLTYRPDIDGLRAVAILAVLLYHAFPNQFHGGFVGVDIFFVISGYLISSIIFKGLESKKFSFIDFYVHRVKRIFPALILVLLTAFGIGWFLLLPDEFRQLGKHMATGSGFVQNIVLWKETGYFDNASELKPLVHLWSLAVEEQFYLIFPALMWLVWRFGLNALMVVLVIALFSFSQNLHETFRDIVKAYFLPQTRFWELLAGSILAYARIFKNDRFLVGARRFFLNPVFFRSLSAEGESRDILNNALSAFGFFVAVMAVFVIDKNRLFPGWWALAPVIAACLMILAGPGSWVNKNILANKIMVWVGLISYPLYLWHWLVLSMIRIVNNGLLTNYAACFAIVVSFVLAWLTYKLIERPVRLGNREWWAPVLVALLVVVGLLGAVTFKKDGFEFREEVRSSKKLFDGLSLNPAGINYPSCSELLKKTSGINYCLQSKKGEPNYAIVGDSHAEHLFYGVAAQSKYNWALLANSSCPPLLGAGVVSDRGLDCQKMMNDIMQYVAKSEKIKTVVFSFFGNYELDSGFAADHVSGAGKWSDLRITGDKPGSKIDLFYYGLNNSIEYMERSGKSVVLVVDIPEIPFYPRGCIGRSFLPGAVENCYVSREVTNDRQKVLREMVAKLKVVHPNLQVFDSIPYFCDEKKCNVIVGGNLMYRDSHHLGIYGSSYLGGELIRWLASRGIG